MPSKLTKEKFIQKARIVHGDIFDYSIANYIGILDKIWIICPKGHKFEQQPSRHLYRRQGCPECRPNDKLTQKEFLCRTKDLFGENLCFSKSQYHNNFTPVSVVCKKHGEFRKVPSVLFTGHGCRKCRLDERLKSGQNAKITNDDFFRNVNRFPLNKHILFDGSCFKGVMHSIIVKCPKHGEIFVKEARNLLRIPCCNKCVLEEKLEKFINKSKKIHGERFDYSKTIYKSSNQKLTITCRTHGDFLATPNAHLDGKGCPSCNISKGERAIELFLIRNDIKYTKEKRFLGCIDKKQLRFDFYLPEYNTCVEYDGYWHFHPYRHDIKRLKNIQRKDKIKNNYCYNNLISLIRIKDLKNIDPTLTELLYSIII